MADNFNRGGGGGVVWGGGGEGGGGAGGWESSSREARPEGRKGSRLTKRPENTESQGQGRKRRKRVNYAEKSRDQEKCQSQQIRNSPKKGNECYKSRPVSAQQKNVQEQKSWGRAGQDAESNDSRGRGGKRTKHRRSPVRKGPFHRKRMSQANKYEKVKKNHILEGRGRAKRNPTRPSFAAGGREKSREPWAKSRISGKNS